MTAALLGGAWLTGGLLPGNQLAGAKEQVGPDLPLLPPVTWPLYPSMRAEGRACGGLSPHIASVPSLPRRLPPPEAGSQLPWAGPARSPPLAAHQALEFLLPPTLAERRGQRLESTPGAGGLFRRLRASVARRPF